MDAHASISAHRVVRPRRATLADAAELAAFAARTFVETYAPPHGHCDPADVAHYVAGHFGLEAQTAELRDPALATFVLRREGAIAGYVQLRVGSSPASVDGFALRTDAADPARPAWGAAAAHALTTSACVASGAPPLAELARLYVDRRWHGHGLADQLLAAALAHTAALGARWLWLSVYARNPRAIAFYARRGFHPIGAATFTMGVDVQADHILVRPVAA